MASYEYKPETSSPEIKWTPLVPPFSEMSPEDRYKILDKLAQEMYGTKQWKIQVAERYGITRATCQKWQQNGAPVWVVQAMTDASMLDAFQGLVTDLRDALNKI